MSTRRKRAAVFIAVIALALITGVLIGIAWDLYDTAVLPYKYQGYVTKYAKEYDVPAEIVFAVIKVESGFRAGVKSKAGAIGLMQLMPDTFEWLTGARHLGEHLPTVMMYDPDVNIRYGTYYLRYLKNKFGDWSTVLAAYNGGEGNVAKWLKDSAYSDDGVTLKSIPFSETDSYVRKVNREISVYREIFGEQNT